MGESEERLRQLVEEFERMCKIWKLRGNESKSKAMNFIRMADYEYYSEWKVA